MKASISIEEFVRLPEEELSQYDGTIMRRIARGWIADFKIKERTTALAVYRDFAAKNPTQRLATVAEGFSITLKCLGVLLLGTIVLAVIQGYLIWQ